MRLPRVRFSMRELLVYNAFMCVMFALSRLPFLAGGVLLVLAVAVANFLVPIRIWRFVVYGGITGIVVAIVALECYLTTLHSGSTHYTYTESNIDINIVHRTRTFVAHLGALLGGTLGIVTYRAKSRVVTATSEMGGL